MTLDGEAFTVEHLTTSSREEDRSRSAHPATVALPAPSTNPAEVLYRVRDLLIAVPTLVLLAPFLALIALAIRRESDGPVFFVQRRTGRGLRPFDCYKFRTMTVVENGDTVIAARRRDPRVTRIGRLLRRASLDEVPQLWNVIRGDMAIVGPRPHALAHDAGYRTMLKDYDRRYTVKPGLTGLAQILDYRGECSTREKIANRLAADLSYIDHRTLATDFVIIALTPFMLVFCRCAY